MAVVKANAYGHGALPITRTLIEEGFTYFMVALLSEALALRQENIYAPILVATPPLAANLSVYSELGLHVSVSTPETCHAVLHYPHSLDVHVKIDTGLNRLGLSFEEARAFLDAMADRPSIRLRGIWTHLATAGNPDTSFAEKQVSRMRAILPHLPAFEGFIHVGNTSSLIHETRYLPPQPNTMYRSGGGLLGISAMPDRAQDVGLLPILTLKSYVLTTKSLQSGESVSYGRRWTAERATRIAVIGTGYADGYPGTFTPASGQPTLTATIHNRRYPIIGSVCMDMCMVDLGNNSDVQPGDEVILFGDGGQSITALASMSGRKAYEITCGISPRVVKTYK